MSASMMSECNWYNEVRSISVYLLEWKYEIKEGKNLTWLKACFYEGCVCCIIFRKKSTFLQNKKKKLLSFKFFFSFFFLKYDFIKIIYDFLKMLGQHFFLNLLPMFFFKWSLLGVNK